MTAIDFKKGFDHYVACHQKTWKHDRCQSCGASECFGCIRKGWFAKHNAEQDPNYQNKWGALQRGDLIENHFVEPAARFFLDSLHDARLIWGGQSQRTIIDGRLSATPDGLVIGVDDDALAHYGVASLGNTGCFNFEVKSIDPRVNLKEEKSVHRGQVQIQMGLTRLKTKYQPNFAIIIYVDASFFDDIDIFVVPFDQHVFDIAVERANLMFDTKDPAELMTEGKIDNVCEYCPYTEICAKTDRLRTPTKGEASRKNETPLVLLEEFEVLARTERAAHNAKKISEADHVEASERLKHWLRETGVKKAQAPDGSIKASISWIKGRSSPDIEAMRADGVDVDKYLRTGEGHARLTISEKGSGVASDEE